MNKLLCFLLVCLTLSCSNDDSGKKPPAFDVDLLLGRWTYHLVMVNDEFQPYAHAPGCLSDYIEIRNSATQPYQFTEQAFEGPNCSGVGTVLRWEADGDHLDLYFYDYVGKFIIVTVSETELHGIYEADFNGDGQAERQEFIALAADE